MESIGEMEAALHYYELSQDYHSIVRVHCYCGNNEKALEICQETGDKAACYHLARQYDSIGDIKKSIHSVFAFPEDSTSEVLIVF